ncbi:putative restriction endonuclease [Tistlia consotensis]|uniref:Putative restriction endonuclease n=1 Tax=Tistlia consotensis USBA 355 TaxID=560819 RepID=A0A1Y6CXU1_9PROT|nr:HNH endonuclease [Tistlia consotensis]SMF82146.1 putative restriction endonuclease [Tistlia consotensis USBA 355]SNS25640.1 putative restriction endonuclease [Tistlia consotensis]
MKGVFDTREGSGYDDDRARRYHFPSRYRSAVEQLVGRWILYREPRREGGRQGYVAAARVRGIVEDPKRPGHAYALMGDYLPFDRPVPMADATGRYREARLRALESRRLAGQALQGRAVRSLSDEDFAAIAREGLGEVLSSENARRLDLDVTADAEALALLGAPPAEQERRIEQILLNRPIRDARFRQQVRLAYDFTCAVTGLRIFNGGGRPEVQAAHILPVAEGGPDVVQNGVALSGTVHWLFDRHLISLTDDHRLLVAHNRVPGELQSLFGRQGEKIRLPADPALHPQPRYLARHRERFVGS